MSYVYKLAGDNLEMAEADLNGFLESQEIDEEAERKERIAETEAEPLQIRRLALTHEVSEKIAEKSLDEEVGIDFEGSFAVRAENIGDADHDTQEWERKIGEQISSEDNTVDLDHPDTVFKLYLFKEKYIIAELVEELPRDKFRERENQKRPFSSPVSIDPVQARLLVNLAGVKPGDRLLDPFCGTGGILIEAGLCGVAVYGTDIQSKMVEGTEENLEEYGIIAHEIQEMSVEDAIENLEGEFEAVVTDLPYGKASLKESDVEEEFMELVEEKCSGKAVFVSNKENFQGSEPDFSIYVHKNLTRYIYISSE
jgi:tRNA (guanine10-N2)-dimethyltransferase